MYCYLCRLLCVCKLGEVVAVVGVVVVGRQVFEIGVWMVLYWMDVQCEVVRGGLLAPNRDYFIQETLIYLEYHQVLINKNPLTEREKRRLREPKDAESGQHKSPDPPHRDQIVYGFAVDWRVRGAPAAAL